MSVYIGHASISEKGTTNGAKGDSTKKEVCKRLWYDIKADFMAVHPDPKVRERHANAVEEACANDNIGYGQNDRNTANTQAKAMGYIIKLINKKCNTDCSALQNMCAVAAKTPKVTYGSNGWTTSTMRKELTKAGYTIITDSKLLKSKDYCVRGAIYVHEGHHTVCGLSNGANYKKTLEKVTGEKYEQKGLPILKEGSINESVKAFQKLTQSDGLYIGQIDGEYGPNAVKACKEVQKAAGLEVDGECGQNTWGYLLGVTSW